MLRSKQIRILNVFHFYGHSFCVYLKKKKKSAAEMEIFSIDAGLALKNKSQVLVILVFETLRFIGAEGLLPLC